MTSGRAFGVQQGANLSKTSEPGMSTTSDESVAALPEPPEGWQYAVIRDDLQIWGCGAGETGRVTQRMRLKYRHVVAPCLAPLRWENP